MLAGLLAKEAHPLLSLSEAPGEGYVDAPYCRLMQFLISGLGFIRASGSIRFLLGCNKHSQSL